MKITNVGAAGGEVTGSTYCVETNQGSVLLTHGEVELWQILAQKNLQRFKLKSALPKMMNVIEV